MVQAICPEYQKLLNGARVALTNWTKGRSKIHEASLQGRGTRNELRTLQASFTGAWALLQFHEHDCELCQVVALLEGAGPTPAPSGNFTTRGSC
jgi:hypothetical protein